MASKKYPLEPLRRLRADQVDAGARSLAQAVQGRATAEAERKRRERAHDELSARADSEAAAERARLEAGALTAGDLLRGAGWGIGVELQKAVSAKQVEDARGEERAAREREAKRLEELAAKKAEAEAVERDRAKWKSARDKGEQAREDEAAEEAHGARAFRRGDR